MILILHIKNDLYVYPHATKGIWAILVFVVLDASSLLVFLSFGCWDISAECLDMPCSLILLLVVAPDFFAHTLRNSWAGVVICLIIGCYLLQEHIRASGGFRNSFTQPNGVSNTVGIILLLVYPLWTLVVDMA